MSTWLRLLFRGFSGLLGIELCMFAARRWTWYCTVPKTSSLHWCGNCAMAAIGVPMELGLFGLLLLLLAASRGRPASGTEPLWWVAALIGLIVSWLGGLEGSLMFLVAFPPLLWRNVRQLVCSWLWRTTLSTSLN